MKEDALEAATERLATKIKADFDLVGPIKADRGDPFSIQVHIQHIHSRVMYVKFALANGRTSQPGRRFYQTCAKAMQLDGVDRT